MKETVFECSYNTAKDRAEVLERMSKVCKKITEGTKDKYYFELSTDKETEKYILKVTYTFEN